MKSRRQFIRIAGAGMLAAGVTPLATARTFDSSGSAAGEEKFSLGIAGYSFREFTAEQSIAMMNRIGVSNLSLKDFHMPMDSSREVIQGTLAKFREAGINVYTVGVVYMRTAESVDQAFEYAALAGMDMMVCAPNYELLPYVEEKVKKYNIRLAIHNHGPDNTLYPNATDIWEHVKELDSRIGICIDIGHTTRDGEDPSVDIEKYAPRIYDVHIKDVDKPSKEGKTVESGRGVIDIPAVVASLRKIGYAGKCSLEFEKDMKDPLAGLAESIGYWKGVLEGSRREALKKA